MAFHFSAMQYERGFASKSVSNWEYQRFFPPRPRTLKGNSKPLCDKNGHLLPTARRDGNFLGHYRGTYHLPLHITRSFATLYNSCLSGRHKYVDYPRDLCCCQYEQQRGQCDWRLTLGRKDDPLWKKPDCQTKCEGLKQLLAINDLHKRCKRAKCVVKGKEKLIPRPPDSSMRNRKRNRKRPVTAFEFNRNRQSEQHSKSGKPAKTGPAMDPTQAPDAPAGTQAPTAAAAQPPMQLAANPCAIPICCPKQDKQVRQISACCLPQDYSVCPPVTCPPARYCGSYVNM